MVTKTTLKVGERVFHPRHGVVKVIGMEEREVGGAKQEFWVLELLNGGRMLVPPINVDEMDIRPLVSEREARALMKKLESEPEVDESLDLKERSQIHEEMLKGCSPQEYNDVIHQLLHRQKTNKLTTTELKILEAARGYFVSEVGSVLGLTTEELQRCLSSKA